MPHRGSPPMPDDPDEDYIEPADEPREAAFREMPPMAGSDRDDAPIAPLPEAARYLAWTEPAEDPSASGDDIAQDDDAEISSGEHEGADGEGLADVLRRGPRLVPRMVIAVAGGKGGVGKTMLAASMGIYLAQIGKRVVLVDAALGSPNLHTMLGIDEPRLSLHSFLRRDVQLIEEVLAETPFTNLDLVPGHDNGFGSANPRPTQKLRLLGQLRALPADYVVIDLDPGTDYNTLDIFLAADMHVVVTQPEPTAIESAFRLIKSAFIRKVSTLTGMKDLLEDLSFSAHCGLPTPNQIHRLARERDPELGQTLSQAMAEFRPRLVVNKIRTRDDLELGPTLTVVGRRHLGLPFDYLGYMENDDLVWVTVRKRRPLLVEYPEAKVCKDLERVARRILSLETKDRPEALTVPKTLTEQNHYEILGLHPGATDEEIRRAQRRLRSVYSQDSNMIFGIVPPEEVELMHRRIEAAYSTLVDPDRRQFYNQALFPSGRELLTGEEDLANIPEPIVEGMLPQITPTPPNLTENELPPIDENTEFTGEMLRAIREARGMELEDIADRTKITRSYLRAIEAEDFLATPAAVYLRGFIKTVARELRLDPARVADSYMKRFAEATRGR